MQDHSIVVRIVSSEATCVGRHLYRPGLRGVPMDLLGCHYEGPHEARASMQARSQRPSSIQRRPTQPSLMYGRQALARMLESSCF